MTKEELLRKIKQVILGTQGEPVVLKDVGPCDTYSVNDYVNFLNDEMPPRSETEFLTHCDNCIACQKALKKYHNSLQLEEQKLYGEMLRKTTHLLDELSKPAQKGFVDVALKISKNVIDVIETTANLLIPRPHIACRGKEEETLDRDVVELVQEFFTPPVSIQASFELEKQEKGNRALILSLSLYNTETEQFLENVEVSVSNGGFFERTLTGYDGSAILGLPGVGEYQIVCHISEGEDIVMRVKVA